VPRSPNTRLLPAHCKAPEPAWLQGRGRRRALAAMQPADFEGLFAYKLIIPAFTWGSILSTFLGPFLFPAAWLSFVALFMVVFVLVSLSQARPQRLQALADLLARCARGAAHSLLSWHRARARRPAARADGVHHRPHTTDGGAYGARDARVC
jgi:hypothetical protein